MTDIEKLDQIAALLKDLVQGGGVFMFAASLPAAAGADKPNDLHLITNAHCRGCGLRLVVKASESMVPEAMEAARAASQASPNGVAVVDLQDVFRDQMLATMPAASDAKN